MHEGQDINSTVKLDSSVGRKRENSRKETGDKGKAGLVGRFTRQNLSAVAASVADPDPYPNLEPVGSKTLSRIRIRKKSFRIREAPDPK